MIARFNTRKQVSTPSSPKRGAKPVRIKIPKLPRKTR
jgi:hypothetical protein